MRYFADAIGRKRSTVIAVSGFGVATVQGGTVRLELILSEKVSAPV
ncbi:MAG TPA: hypothetical protein VNT12_00810 [Rubrobacter sp.]|jgi:hypothetical protein|nr:hypothetical protein [Rubrobacter sp.]